MGWGSERGRERQAGAPCVGRRAHCMIAQHPSAARSREKDPLMAPMRRFGWPDLVSLLLVLAVAAGLRAGYLIRCCDRATSSGPLRVQDVPPPVPGSEDNESEELIRNVREHRSFSSHAPFAEGEERTAHVAPAYPWLVGHLGRVVPEGRVNGWVRWIQMALGTLTAGLYFFFARRAFRSLLVGLLAG